MENTADELHSALNHVHEGKHACDDFSTHSITVKKVVFKKFRFADTLGCTSSLASVTLISLKIKNVYQSENEFQDIYT